MRLIFCTAVLSLISTSTFGAGGGLGGSSDTVQLGIDEDNNIVFAYVQKGKSPSFEDFHSYPFKEECEHTKTGFTCRADGHTPLAGTTWGNYTGSNFKNGKPKCAPVFYECVKGCQSGVPRELSGSYEPSEEGECE